MKVTNATKNMRQRFFRSTRRKLDRAFDALPWVSPNMRDAMEKPDLSVPPPIYTAPLPRQQGVKGKQ